MTNIYIRQMKKLGLNVKQYAQLLNMPYEVVRDFINRKEGDYSMGITDMIKRNMISKYQEIEQNKDNAKIKALEIKQNTETKRYWYEENYTVELLLNKLNLKTKADFERNYDILVNGERASKWVYYCLVGKNNYDNHEVSKEVQEQFIEQLYDILVNDNVDKYKREIPTEIKTFPSQRKPIKNKNYKNEYFKWFRDFDVKSYMKKNNLTNDILSKELGLGVCTISHLVSKKHYTKRTLQKLYSYVKETKEEQEYKEIAKKYIDEEILDDKKVKDETEIYETVVYPRDYETLNKEDKDTIRIEPKLSEENLENKRELQQEINKSTNTNDEILRKILINRLTEEEKELIRIFGGKLC